MQSEPSTVSLTATTEEAPRKNAESRQHGLHAHEHPVALPPAECAGSGTETTPSEDQPALDAAFARSLQDAEQKPCAGSRLSSPPPATPSAPAVNRIAEYEKASIPLVRRRNGPAFEVIKKQRIPGDKRSPIQELPNEVLTHALAQLSPADLTSVALVSKRFHDLVTGPHAWRSAFAHYFPGADSVDAIFRDAEDVEQDVVRSEKRAFTRLTPLASWRSEYIMRTRLLRSLVRGKPVQPVASPGTARAGNGHTPVPMVRYEAQLFTTINHLHAAFKTGGNLNSRSPRFIHGADDVGAATSSDPSAAKVEHWGLSDPQTFLQFNERFPGDAQYGLGPGEVVGVPNVMDVSQPYGMVYGEGSPGGMTYYRSTEEMRGRFLLFSSAMSVPDLGIPRIASVNEAVTCVWIAKSPAIPSLSEGLVGVLSGSSLGVLTAYSLGSNNNGNHHDQRFGRGEMTARWAISPGVPIIGIAIDPEYSLKRHAENRIWAVVLNALGEVYYLTQFPKRPHIDCGAKSDGEGLERTAWLSGRTVKWNVVEPSRRVARPDPYAAKGIDGSYSPRSSWNGMCLSKEQIKAETHEIADFATRKPKDFQKACVGWDMRRRLTTDFAGDNGCNACEHVLVVDCGLDEDTTSGIKRYTRCRFQEGPPTEAVLTPPLTTTSTLSTSPPSLFGSTASVVTAPSADFTFERLEDSLSPDGFNRGSITPCPMSDEWRVSTFLLHGLKRVQVLATAIDSSTLATETTSEVPPLSKSGPSTASSPNLTPLSTTAPVVEAADMPGLRARLFAVGTHTGSILIWNMRAAVPKSAESTSVIKPVRIICTESPQISCLALTSLYLVHGGNDGLVQAWDPLGSTMMPIRTLHSRHSARARRRLVQAQATPQGVGINLFAAGAICLDPDATVLCGMVSLGIQLHYWSYSSSAADQYKAHKRRRSRSERGSNNGGERFSRAPRGNLKEYITNEKYELDHEREVRRKQADRLAGRFGTELMEGNEEEIMAYAAMLSQETLEQENMGRASDTSDNASTVVSTDLSAIGAGNATPSGGSPSPRLSTPKSDEEFDSDVAQAIRYSFAASPSAAAYDIPIRHAKLKGRKGSPDRPSPRVSPRLTRSSKANEMSDLDFALQLSLAEEQSKEQASEDFPVLRRPGSGNGKDKGRSRS